MSKKLTNLDVENFLKDFKDKSEIMILEEGKEKNELLESARKRGIIISKNDLDLGIIKTVYCFTSKANNNRTRLPKEEFIKILPQIVGRPMNYAHDRHFIFGFYIDYKYILKDEKAIAYAIFFKGNYPKIWKKVIKFQKKGKLSSSYEIRYADDAVEYLSDGTHYLHNISIAGGALVFEEFGDIPAFKDAKVLAIAKNLNLEEHIGKDCLAYASKYKEEDIIVAEDYFMKNVKENYKKLQEEKKLQEQKNKKVIPKIEDKKPKIKVEEPKKVEIQPGKIKCSNCQEIMDYNGIDIRIKCSKCFAILNKEGVMQYPPQIKDFKMLCPACKVGNWLILSKTDKGAKLRCETCAKEFKIEFTQEDPQAKKILNKLNLIRKDIVYCYQCGHSINLAGLSTIKDRNVKCPKCSIEFEFNIESNQSKKVSKIEEIKIDKIEKSTKTEKGGKEMDYKLELSKFHRYVEKFEDIEKSIDKEYNESKEDAIEKSARLTAEHKNALPDSDFAVVVRVKDRTTGKMRKIRMFPIHDKAHVRNTLARLGQPASKVTLARLGVSIEAVRTKILAKSKKTEPKVKKKVEKAKDVTSDAQKYDLALYALENKIAKYANGIRKLASKVRSTKKELATAKTEKEEKVKFYMENAKTILKRRKELGDTAKDLSDEQIINDKDFEIAKLNKELDKKNNTKIATASEIVGDKKKDNEFYAKKHKKIDAIAYKETKNRI